MGIYKSVNPQIRRSGNLRVTETIIMKKFQGF